MQASDIRALVIEDESDSALLLTSTLEYSGAQVMSAPTAEAALTALQQADPNILIVDLALPGIDGWKFLETVRATPEFAHIPAVVVSAYLNPTVAKKALTAGFSACFPKPIDTMSFVRQLVTLLEGSEN